MLTRFKRLCRNPIAASFGVAALLATAATSALFWFSANSTTLTSIKANTEIVSFSVFNPELAIIYARGLKVSTWPDDESRENQCFEGAFLPGVGAQVTYLRTENGPLQITIEGRGELRSPQGNVVPFDGELLLFRDNEECGTLQAERFPVWGPGQIGSPFSMRGDGPGPILVSGSLDVFGRTLNLPLLGDGGSLYAAIEGMAVPPGSLIETNVGEGVPGNDDAEAAMFGFIEVNETDPGFSLSVSTESRELRLTPPGARADSSRIDLGLFVQALNDPGFLKIQLFFIFMFALWPFAIELIRSASSAISKAEDESKDTAGPKIGEG